MAIGRHMVHETPLCIEAMIASAIAVSNFEQIAR
jgi:hypothetical protein